MSQNDEPLPARPTVAGHDVETGVPEDQELQRIKERDREEKRARDAREAEQRCRDRELRRIPEAIDALRRSPGPLDEQTADETWLDRLARLLDALKGAGNLELLQELPSRGNARRFTRRCVALLIEGKRRQAVGLLRDIGPGKLDAELAQERRLDLPDDLCRLFGVALPQPKAPQPPVPHSPETANEDHPNDAEPPSERRQDILHALLLLKAVGPRLLVSRWDAARKVDPADKASSYNRAIASLVREGLVQSKRGPGGGIWLTAKGRSLAEQLTSSRRE